MSLICLTHAMPSTTSVWSTLTTLAISVSSSSLYFSNNLAIFLIVQSGSATLKERCARGMQT